MTKSRVLIVADDPALSSRLWEPLRVAGCELRTARSGAAALQLAPGFLPKLVLLAGSLPDADPLELSWQLRETLHDQHTALFVMAGGRDGPAASGLEEIVRRCARFLSEPDSAETNSDTLCQRGLVIDRCRHRASIDGRSLDLTCTEFRLLWCLANKPGYVLSRGQLTEACAGTGATVQQRTIDAHVKAIRRKLQHRSSLIETVRGVGYRFQDVEMADVPAQTRMAGG